MTSQLGKKAAGSVVQNLAANTFILGVGFVTSTVLARSLGPSGRGELQAIMLWPMLLVSLGSLGFDQAVSYFCARYRDKAASYFATAWTILVVWALPLFAFGWFLLPFILTQYDDRVVNTAQHFLLLIPIQFIGNLPFWALKGMGEFKKWNVVRSLYSVMWLTVVVLSVLSGKRDVSFIAYGYLTAMSINCALWMYSMLRTVPGPYRPQMSMVPQMMRYGIPAVLTQVPSHLNMRLDQFVMSIFMPADLLGLYVVAVAWSGLTSTAMNAISPVVFAEIAGMSDNREQARVSWRALRVSLVVASLLFVVIMPVTPIAMPLIYGSDFTAAVPSTIILVFANLIMNVSSIASEMLRGMGKPKWPMLAEFLALIVTGALLLWLLPSLGILGAAIASLGAYSLTLGSIVALLSWETKSSPAQLIPGKQDVFAVVGYLLTLVFSPLKAIYHPKRGTY